MASNIDTAVSDATGRVFRAKDDRTLGGGCISQASRLTGEDGRRFFLKRHRASLLPMFEAEAEGLRELAATGTVTVPEPVAWGVDGGEAYLVLTWLELGGDGSQRQLGAQLAALHDIPQPYFGWHRDNFLGSTPQPNTHSEQWPAFWREHRLGHQLRLAEANGHGGRLLDVGWRLCEALDALLGDHACQPSLLHGDLWGGNAAALENGEPVIFDPACYYGDAEAELAMMTLFGGFGADCFAAYHDHRPKSPGFERRQDMYQLYHVLNHLNLFGGGYGGQALRLMERLV